MVPQIEIGSLYLSESTHLYLSHSNGSKDDECQARAFPYAEPKGLDHSGDELAQ